jgi:hypothetical protein
LAAPCSEIQIVTTRRYRRRPVRLAVWRYRLAYGPSSTLLDVTLRVARLVIGAPGPVGPIVGALRLRRLAEHQQVRRVALARVDVLEDQHAQAAQSANEILPSSFAAGLGPEAGRFDQGVVRHGANSSGRAPAQSQQPVAVNWMRELWRSKKPPVPFADVRSLSVMSSTRFPFMA